MQSDDAAALPNQPAERIILLIVYPYLYMMHILYIQFNILLVFFALYKCTVIDANTYCPIKLKYPYLQWCQ